MGQVDMVPAPGGLVKATSHAFTPSCRKHHPHVFTLDNAGQRHWSRDSSRLSDRTRFHSRQVAEGSPILGAVPSLALQALGVHLTLVLAGGL